MGKAEQVLAGFWDLCNKRIWLDERTMAERLEGCGPSEVHCIEYIGKNTDANGTELADASHMTRSAISKLTKKLIESGLIESYQKPENRKEIYFRLTSQGKAIEKAHTELYKEYQERDKAVFAQISDEQYDSMLDFVKRYGKHLDAEIEKMETGTTD